MSHHKHRTDKKHDKKHDKEHDKKHDKRHDKNHDKKPKPPLKVEIQLSGQTGVQLSGQVNIGQVSTTLGSTFEGQPSGQAYLSLLRPLIGLNYEPSPSNYTNLPPPQIYFDTDFSNLDFAGLWSPTDNQNGVGRNDVVTLKQSLKADVIKMFNWNPARNHTPFLNYCENNNLKVIVPISNFFVNDPIGQRANIITIINQAQHDAVIAFAIGNELSASAAQNIARVFQLIVNNDLKNRPVCSPVRQNDYPAVPLDIGSFCALMGLGNQFNSLFFQAINVYPPPNNVVNGATANLQIVVNEVWPKSFFSFQPLLITEYGWNSATASLADQASSVGAQARFIRDASENINKPLFLGGLLFEYSDEKWKPDEGGGFDGNSYGLLTFSGQSTTGHTTTGQTYPIDKLVQKPAYQAYQNGLIDL